MKPGENGCIGCEEGHPMPGTVVCSRCVEELGSIQKNYLIAGFALSTATELSKMILAIDHKPEKVSETTLFDDRYARVLNSSDVKLTDDDTVYIDRFGRVNGFRLRTGQCYIGVES